MCLNIITCWSVLADEKMAVSAIEQLWFCTRYVDKISDKSQTLIIHDLFQFVINLRKPNESCVTAMPRVRDMTEQLILLSISAESNPE
nr:unnamed protein product [Callosobruchus analis]